MKSSKISFACLFEIVPSITKSRSPPSLFDVILDSLIFFSILFRYENTSPVTQFDTIFPSLPETVFSKILLYLYHSLKSQHHNHST